MSYSLAIKNETQRFPTQGAVSLGCFLALLQALDGILTSIGISRYGLAVEGNPILREIMSQWGHIPTLAVVKSLAIVFVIFLTVVSYRLTWVKNAMGAVSFVYLLLAILPWTYILFIGGPF